MISFFYKHEIIELRWKKMNFMGSIHIVNLRIYMSGKFTISLDKINW